MYLVNEGNLEIVMIFEFEVSHFILQLKQYLTIINLHCSMEYSLLTGFSQGDSADGCNVCGVFISFWILTTFKGVLFKEKRVSRNKSFIVNHG